MILQDIHFCKVSFLCVFKINNISVNVPFLAFLSEHGFTHYLETFAANGKTDTVWILFIVSGTISTVQVFLESVFSSDGNKSVHT